MNDGVNLNHVAKASSTSEEDKNEIRHCYNFRLLPHIEKCSKLISWSNIIIDEEEVSFKIHKNSA